MKGRGVPSRLVDGKGRLPVSQDRCVAFRGLDRRDWVRRALRLDQQSRPALAGTGTCPRLWKFSSSQFFPALLSHLLLFLPWLGSHLHLFKSMFTEHLLCVSRSLRAGDVTVSMKQTALHPRSSTAEESESGPVST